MRRPLPAKEAQPPQLQGEQAHEHSEARYTCDGMMGWTMLGTIDNLDITSDWESISFSSLFFFGPQAGDPFYRNFRRVWPITIRTLSGFLSELSLVDFQSSH